MDDIFDVDVDFPEETDLYFVLYDLRVNQEVKEHYLPAAIDPDVVLLHVDKGDYRGVVEKLYTMCDLRHAQSKTDQWLITLLLRPLDYDGDLYPTQQLNGIIPGEFYILLAHMSKVDFDMADFLYRLKGMKRRTLH